MQDIPMKGDSIVIDGWPEAWEQEVIDYLLARECTTPAEIADHFNLSETSAAYWLGCLVKSGRLRIARVERTITNGPADSLAGERIVQGRNARGMPQAILQVPKASETI